MTAPPASDGALARARIAIGLLAAAPHRFGGIRLRGGGPARDQLVADLRAALPATAPWRRMPGHIDEDALSGGIDLNASLASGEVRHQAGLLSAARGGTILVPMAERMTTAQAGRIAQAMDEAGDSDQHLLLLLLDDGIEPDERPPAALLDRIAFDCDLSTVTAREIDATPAPWPAPIGPPPPLTDADLAALAGTADALGILSARPLRFAMAAAAILAAQAGRASVAEPDLAMAAALLFAPRATRLPTPDAGEQAAPEQPPAATDAPSPEDRDTASEPMADQVLAAARAVIPPDVLALIAQDRAHRSATAGTSGARLPSTARGKPRGSRPGVPGGGRRLAIIDTLRAAAPWQLLRRRDQPDQPADRLLFRRDDLRIRRFEERSGTVTLFCVDASGSAARARLAEAKGAAELILGQAYVKRAEVALIAFRGTGAELLLPPTRSLTRAKRALADLPGGGGTPLASGLALAARTGAAIAARGRTPMLVLMTDGSANVDAAGIGGRAKAKADGLAAARAIAATRLDSVVIDISPRPRPDAQALADAMQARYLPLPMANAHALEHVVQAMQP